MLDGIGAIANTKNSVCVQSRVGRAVLGTKAPIIHAGCPSASEWELLNRRWRKCPKSFPIPTVCGDILVTMTSMNDLELLAKFTRDQSQDAAARGYSVRRKSAC